MVSSGSFMVSMVVALIFVTITLSGCAFGSVFVKNQVPVTSDSSTNSPFTATVPCLNCALFVNEYRKLYDELKQEVVKEREEKRALLETNMQLWLWCIVFANVAFIAFACCFGFSFAIQLCSASVSKRLGSSPPKENLNAALHGEIESLKEKCDNFEQKYIHEQKLREVFQNQCSTLLESFAAKLESLATSRKGCLQCLRENDLRNTVSNVAFLQNQTVAVQTECADSTAPDLTSSCLGCCSREYAKPDSQIEEGNSANGQNAHIAIASATISATHVPIVEQKPLTMVNVSVALPNDPASVTVVQKAVIDNGNPVTVISRSTALAICKTWAGRVNATTVTKNVDGCVKRFGNTEVPVHGALKIALKWKQWTHVGWALIAENDETHNLVLGTDFISKLGGVRSLLSQWQLNGDSPNEEPKSAINGSAICFTSHSTERTPKTVTESKVKEGDVTSNTFSAQKMARHGRKERLCYYCRRPGHLIRQCVRCPTYLRMHSFNRVTC